MNCWVNKNNNPNTNLHLISHITHYWGIKNILKRVHVLLPSDREHEKVFKDTPIVGFRRAKSLKDMLVRAKLPKLEEIPGCSGCGARRCQVCEFVENATTFSDKDGSHTFEIRKGSLNCNSMYVVYLMQYKVCKNKIVVERRQYLDLTIRNVNLRNIKIWALKSIYLMMVNKFSVVSWAKPV